MFASLSFFTRYRACGSGKAKLHVILLETSKSFPYKPLLSPHAVSCGAAGVFSENLWALSASEKADL